MIFKYSCMLRIKERLSKPKELILAIFSIAIALYFVMMFLCKIEETLQKIHYYTQNEREDVSVYTLNKPIDSQLSEGSQSVMTDMSIYLNNKAALVTVLGVDKSYPHYYPIHDMSENIWQAFIESDQHVIVAKDLARKLQLSKGERLSIGDKQYKVYAIIDDAWYAKKLILPFEQVESQGNAKLKTYNALLITKKASEWLKGVAVSQENSLSNIFMDEVLSLKHFIRFIWGFSFVFFLIAVINIYLIFRTMLQQSQRASMIKRLYGEPFSAYAVSQIVEFTSLCLIAFHISMVFYYVTLPFVPSFFYFHLTHKVYISELLLVVGGSILLAFGSIARQLKSR